jgi:streptogramin lyase
MSKPFLFPSTGFFTASPSFGPDGKVSLRLTEIVAFVPIYTSDAEADAITSVQPLTADWDGIEHPEQLIRRPDGMFVDRRGHVGDERAAIERFREYHRRRRPDPRRDAQRHGRRVCRYSASVLLDHDD